MAGASITIDVDDAELKAKLRKLLGNLSSPAAAMREIGAVVRDSTRQRFKTETAPDGSRWKENSDATLMRYLEERAGSFRKGRTEGGGKGPSAKGARRIGGKKILTNRGYLADTLAWQLQDGGRAVAVGSNRVYAAAQQFGMARGYAGVTKRGSPIPWGNIPARPFLGISGADGDEILTILRDHLAR